VAKRKRTYYWILTVNDKGKRTLIGPKNDDFEAHRISEDLDRPSRVIPLQTRNVSAASRMLKGKVFSELGDIDEASSNISHKL